MTKKSDKKASNQTVGLRWLYFASAHPKWIFFIAAFVITAAVWTSAQKIPLESEVKFSLNKAEKLFLKQNIDPFLNYPPTCGCLDPQYGKWSGISFASRKIEISDSQKEAWLHISASRPGSLMSGMMGNKLSITEWIVEKPNDDIQPFYFISKNEISIAKYKYTNTFYDNTYGGEFNFVGKINIYIPNDYPVISWNGSTKSFSQLNLFEDQIYHDRYLYINDYTKYTNFDNKYIGGTGVNFDGGHLDIANSTIFIWFTDPESTKKTIIRKITAPYSVRIAFRIHQKNGTKSNIKIKAQQLDIADFVAAKGQRLSQPLRDAIFESEGNRVIDQNSGTEFSRIPEGQKYRMEMREPEVPPPFGVNLYGDYTKFSALGVTGNVSFGTNLYQLANNDFDFNGQLSTSAMKINEFLPINFVYQKDNLISKSEFSGIGNLKIENTLINSYAYLLYEAMSFWQLSAIIFALLMFMISLISWIRRRMPSA